MPEEINNTIVKHRATFLEKLNILSKIRVRLPKDKKRLVPLLLIVISLPLVVGIALVQQELRSRASGGDGTRKPMIIGMNIMGGNHFDGREKLSAAVEDIKYQTGEIPRIIPIWRHFDTPTSFPDVDTQNYLKEKGIGLAIYLMPSSNKMERYDGRFLLSHETVADSSLLAGQVRFDSATPSDITKIYVSKDSYRTGETNLLAKSWVSGKKIKVLGSKANEDVDYQNEKHFEFTINSKTDKGTYWELGVTSVKTASLDGVFSDNKPVFITMPDAFEGSKYSNKAIADGEMDEYFRDFARQAKAYGEPVLFRYAHEMNGDWYVWSEGRKETRSFGRRKFFGEIPTKANYVAAWKHVYNVIKPIAPNVQFYWCSSGKPNMDYYPGDKFTDYVGFDGYSGSRNNEKTQPHRSIREIFEDPIRILEDKTKRPIIVGELGINATHSEGVSGDFSSYRRQWLIDGYSYAYKTWPNLKAIIYYNIDMRDKGQEKQNWELNTPTEIGFPDITNAYKRIATDPRFQGKFGKTVSDPDPSKPSEPTQPPPGSGANLPFGFHDTASCTNISGWTCDEDNFGKSVKVEFYADSPAGEGTLIGTTIANVTRENAVGEQCGNVNSHGFKFTTPESVKTSDSRHIYAYAIDETGKKVRLNSTPKVLTCEGPVKPSITPPDPSKCQRKLPTVTYLDKQQSAKKNETVTYRVKIKNNDSNCSDRKIAFDLITPTTRWDYSPEITYVKSGETKTVQLKVTSGRYATPGTKKLDLTVRGAYKPHAIFGVQTLQFIVTQ